MMLLVLTVAHAQNAGLARSLHRYTLSGRDLHLTYLSSGPNGKPRLQYCDAVQTLQFTGDEIRTATLEVGTLVTITTAMTIDSGYTSFTVVLPQLNFGPLKEAPIKTFGVTTVHRFLAVGPPLQGQTDLYTVTELSGTETVVPF